MRHIPCQPLTPRAFAPFGDILDAAGPPDKWINAGACGRFHDRARLDFGPGGRAGISIFDAEPRTLPYRLDLLERHPDGAQSFLPMHSNPWLAIVADAGQKPEQTAEQKPGQIHAFLVAPGQGINLLRGTWHGVLTPLHAPGLFAVVDRIGPGANLEEHRLPEPVLITAAP